HYLYLIGRLKPEVSLTQARADLETLLAQWPAADGANPNATPGQPGFVHTPNTVKHRLRFDDLQADVVGSAGTTLWALQAAVALVLLIACANLANLLLMRAESRHKELSVRVALGAGQGRLVRQFIAEGMVLSAAGAVVGLALAYWGVHALAAASAGSIPRATDVGIDPRVLVATLCMAVGTGLVFGLAPMLHLAPATIGTTLRDGGSRTTANAARHRVRRALVVAEMALAVMLVIGSGLLIRSLWNLTRVDAGFDRANLTTFSITLPGATYSDGVRVAGFWQRLTSRLATIPGVTRVAAMSGLPPQRQVNANDTQFEGIVPTKDGPLQNIDYYQYVTPGYLKTMGIPLVAGRSFTDGDAADAPPVAMINEAAAKRFYPNQNPVGRRIRSNGDTIWLTIVGVVKDVKQGGVDAKTGTELYYDVPQMPRETGFAPTSMNIVLRSSLPPSTLASSIRGIVNSLDAALPVVGLRSMDDVFADSVGRARFLTMLLSIFAAVALVLAAIGIYGVLAYAVTERRREIGIRMALGASRDGVLAMVLRQGVGLAAVGIGLGLAGAVGATRLAKSLLFGVGTTDPLTFTCVAAFMVAVAVVACVVPARRATRVDPLVALRSE
ncbi:MAG TPA: ABC transporter permease, partial [Gemmatimonadaceae bacterium]|nr:ABC transporter permease [Gemmatimonadaceae bacterium]